MQLVSNILHKCFATIWSPRRELPNPLPYQAIRVVSHVSSNATPIRTATETRRRFAARKLEPPISKDIADGVNSDLPPDRLHAARVAAETARRAAGEARRAPTPNE